MRLRKGRSGTTDRFILLVNPGFYLSVRPLRTARLRVCFGGPYRTTVQVTR